MSSELFETLTDDDRNRPTYAPGPRSLQHIADPILRQFFEKTDQRELNDYAISDHHLEEILTLEEKEAKDLLDVLAVEVLRRGDDTQQKNVDRLVRPIVQSLFDSGMNDFTLDYRYFRTLGGVGSRLNGERERKLRIRYSLQDPPDKALYGSVGATCHDIQLQIISCSALWSGGYQGRDSTFIFPRLPVELGHWAEDSVFYVGDSRAADKAGPRFFELRNRLFIPDSVGDWEEYTE